MCWSLLLYCTRQSKYWNPADSHACCILSSLLALFSSLLPKDSFLKLFTKTGLFLRDNIEEETWIEGIACYFQYSWTSGMGGKDQVGRMLNGEKRCLHLKLYSRPFPCRQARPWFVICLWGSRAEILDSFSKLFPPFIALLSTVTPKHSLPSFSSLPSLTLDIVSSTLLFPTSF